MNIRYYKIFVLLIALFLSGCASFPPITPKGLWDATEVGEIRGKLMVEWYSPDKFIYRPDPNDPLRFIRKKEGIVIDTITPGNMLTDGGSIPRVLWFQRGYSPWTYGPAYIIHDWLFELKHCNFPGSEKYNHLVAAEIMAEVMKTQIISEKGKVDYYFKHMNLINNWTQIYNAVRVGSGGLWKKGQCEAFTPKNMQEQPANKQ